MRISRQASAFFFSAWLLVAAVARSEVPVEIVSVPPGKYDLAAVLTKSGTAERWICYRPEKPGAVTFRGGEVKDVQYVILDGFSIDSRLRPDYPQRAHGCDIRVSNITLRNCEVIGPKDVHSGYDMTDRPNSKEFVSGIPSTGITARDGCRNIVFENIVVHGFNNAGSFGEGTNVVIRDSLLRNSFNGLSFRGDELTLERNVMWVHPNHQFSVHAPEGTLRFHDNLFVDAQDMIKAGASWSGCKNVYLTHNTFWIPASKPSSDYSGLQLNRVTGEIVIRDNLLVNKIKSWLSVDRANIANVKSDYSLYFHHESAGEDFFNHRNGETITDLNVEQWQALSGQDRRSLFAQAPQFEDPPHYLEPLPTVGSAANDWGFWTPPSREAARARLRLKPGSAGKSAASDGMDVGILP